MDEVSVARSPNPTDASVGSCVGAGEGFGDAVDVNRSVLRSLLDLHDAATESGLDGRHIQAWLAFEYEAMRLGVPVEIGRAELEALVEAGQDWRRSS